ncbi:DUF1361 domain-containing protein, partial [Staphylococcus aureus]|nr:DUF1361 domain-containing protein [Staphylococcus aureus]
MQSRYIARIYFLILFIVSLFETKIFQFMTLNLFLESSPDSCVKCYTMFLPFLL